MSELCSSERTTFVCIFSDTPKIFYSRSIHSVEGQIDPFSSQRKINKLKSVLAGHPLKLSASQSPVTSKTKASARASLSCMCSASLSVITIRRYRVDKNTFLKHCVKSNRCSKKKVIETHVVYLDELSVMHILISSKLIPDKRLLEISKTCELG